MDYRAYRIARAYVEKRIREAARNVQGRDAPEDFWNWMRQNHPRVRNPNPGGREKDITPDTLKSYAEGNAPYAPQAGQIVQQYLRQYQQAKAQQEGERRVVKPPEDRQTINRQNLEIAQKGKEINRRVLSSGGRASQGGINQSFIVTLEHDGRKQDFIHKPAEGEERFLRMGIPGGQYHAREAAAYAVDRMLGGRGIVPVTHTRGDEDGSYQVWARGARSMHGDDMDELVGKVPIEELSKTPDFQRINVLDLLIGHEDRHRGNLLWHFEGEEKPENLRLVAIDNGLSISSPTESPDHRVYVNPFDGWYVEDKKAVQEAFDRGAFNEALNLPRKQRVEAREKGNEAVAKSLSDLDPKMVESLKKVDIRELAKALTESGVDEEGAVRAVLVRVASLRANPNLFRDVFEESDGVLEKAWQQFQHSSGEGYELLHRSGAGKEAEKEIVEALGAARPKKGWSKPPSLKEANKAMQDMDNWGASANPDAPTAKPGGAQVHSEIDWSKMASRVRDRWLAAETSRTSRTQRGRGRKLTISFVDNRTLKPKVMGVFELTPDKKVKEKYHDHRFKSEIRRGVRLMGRTFKPEDGPRFMAALEKTYGARSMFDVKRT